MHPPGHIGWTYVLARWVWPLLITGVLVPVAQGGIIPVEGWMLLSSADARIYAASVGVAMCAVWFVVGTRWWTLLQVAVTVLIVVMMGRCVRLVAMGPPTWSAWGATAAWFTMTAGTMLAAAKLARHEAEVMMLRQVRAVDGPVTDS